MKGLNYLTATVKTYRQAIDLYYMAPDQYLISKDWQKALAGINQRGYCTGFYLNDPDAILPNYEKDKPENNPKFVGKIIKAIDRSRFFVGVRNKIQIKDTIDILTASGPNQANRIAKIMTQNNEETTVAQPNASVFIETECPSSCGPGDIIQKTNTGN